PPSPSSPLSHHHYHFHYHHHHHDHHHHHHHHYPTITITIITMITTIMTTTITIMTTTITIITIIPPSPSPSLPLSLPSSSPSSPFISTTTVTVITAIVIIQSIYRKKLKLRNWDLQGPPYSLDSFPAKCGYFLRHSPDVSSDRVQAGPRECPLPAHIHSANRLRGLGVGVGVPRMGFSPEAVAPELQDVSLPLPLGSTSGHAPMANVPLEHCKGNRGQDSDRAAYPVAAVHRRGAGGFSGGRQPDGIINSMMISVDVTATTLTFQSPRQDPVQRQEVSGGQQPYQAGSLKEWHPRGGPGEQSAGSPRQALRVADERLLQSRIQLVVLIVVAGTVIPARDGGLVHIPKQRLDLVKRGSYLEESLSLKFPVTENRDFAAVGVLAAGVIQVQQCQEAQGALGTQAFYRVVLSLGFAEVAAPILWTAESSFQGVGESHGFLLPGLTGPTPNPGKRWCQAHWLELAGEQEGCGELGRVKEPLQEDYHLLPFPSSKLQEASGKGFLRVSLTSLPVGQPMEVPRPDFHPRAHPHEASVDPARHEAPLFHHHSTKGSPTQTSGHVSSPSNSDHSPEKAGLPESSHLSAAQLKSPPTGRLSQGDVAADQPMRGPWQASKEVQPLTKPLVTSLAEESLRAPTDISSPSLAEPRDPFTAGQGTPRQEPAEPTLATSLERHRPPELQNIMQGLLRDPLAGESMESLQLQFRHLSEKAGPSLEEGFETQPRRRGLRQRPERWTTEAQEQQQGDKVGGDERGPMRSDSKGSLLRACAAPALHVEDSMEVAAGADTSVISEILAESSSATPGLVAGGGAAGDIRSSQRGGQDGVMWTDAHSHGAGYSPAPPGTTDPAAGDGLTLDQASSFAQLLGPERGCNEVPEHDTSGLSCHSWSRDISGQGQRSCFPPGQGLPPRDLGERSAWEWLRDPAVLSSNDDDGDDDDAGLATDGGHSGISRREIRGCSLPRILRITPAPSSPGKLSLSLLGGGSRSPEECGLTSPFTHRVKGRQAPSSHRRWMVGLVSGELQPQPRPRQLLPFDFLPASPSPDADCKRTAGPFVSFTTCWETSGLLQRQGRQGQELQQLTPLHEEPTSALPMILLMEERSAASLGRLSSPRAKPLLNSPGGSPMKVKASELWLVAFTCSWTDCTDHLAPSQLQDRAVRVLRTWGVRKRGVYLCRGVHVLSQHTFISFPLPANLSLHICQVELLKQSPSVGLLGEPHTAGNTKGLRQANRNLGKGSDSDSGKTGQCPSVCHICLGAPGPGTGVRSEKQLFLAMTEKGMTSACPRILGDFLRRGWAGGLQKGGEQELGDGTLRELVSAECLGLGKQMEAPSGSGVPVGATTGARIPKMRHREKPPKDSQTTRGGLGGDGSTIAGGKLWPLSTAWDSGIAASHPQAPLSSRWEPGSPRAPSPVPVPLKEPALFQAVDNFPGGLGPMGAHLPNESTKVVLRAPELGV
ncbi:hypothetical protein E2I00_003577, partial [Balaenoptera physalus]